jgi:mRNA-degrading endonuclease RelE of RelBE toxin-antitoxin system
MRKYSGKYTPVYTPTFRDQLAGMQADYKKRVEAKIDSLSVDPYHNTKFMKYPHQGRRKARITDADRLAFVICEECRRLGNEKYNLCSDCNDADEKALVIAYMIFGHDY